MKYTLSISKIVSVLSILFWFGNQAIAQVEFPEDKVKWKFTVEQTEKDTYIVGKASIVAHWHINAIYLPAGSFGYATKFALTPNKDFKPIGKVVEPKPIMKHDDLADEDLVYHEGTVGFKQKIEVKSTKPFTVNGTYSFQPCDENHCLPPYDGKFSVKVTPNTGVTGEVAPEETTNDEVQNNVASVSNEMDNTQGKSSTDDKIKSKKDEISKTDDANDVTKMSLLTIFIVSFGSGFLALLTPCVFPMIPMTVSFFTKRSKTRALGIRNALIYGISIIVIYILLGVVVTAVFGAEALNNMATNPTFNFIFFLILVFFAVSFMGAFEIRLPSSWANKADAASDRGGLIGIFFMALALALVSFSCTGPIVSSLLIQSARSGGLAPIIGMFGFSLALALPFALFAAFPGWMNSLPKSGGWLNTVKVVLGLLELALAFKFLSNADLSLQLHYLEREVFLAIWIAIFGVLALYLFGFLTLPHDSPVERLSVGRALFGTFVLAFVMYMIPGLWGAPVKLISAFPPPSSYAESPGGFGGNNGATLESGAEENADMHVGPQNLQVFHDFDKAKAYAKEVGKPLFVDFTGHNCVNCRKMEESVWGEAGVIEHLKNDVVIVSLHVDERIDLPKSEQKTVKVAGRSKKLLTTGDKWFALEINEFNSAAQPFYVMLDKDGNKMSNGSADFQNHNDHKVFEKWLNDGLKAYSK